MAKSYDVLAAINRMLQSRERREGTELDAALRRMQIAEQSRGAGLRAELTKELAELGYAHTELMETEREGASIREERRREQALIRGEERESEKLIETRQEDYADWLKKRGVEESFESDMMLLKHAMEMSDKTSITEASSRLAILTTSNESNISSGVSLVFDWFSNDYARSDGDRNEFVDLLIESGFTEELAGVVAPAVFSYAQQNDASGLINVTQSILGELRAGGDMPLSLDFKKYGINTRGEGFSPQAVEGKPRRGGEFGNVISTMAASFDLRSKYAIELEELGNTGDTVFQQLGETEANQIDRLAYSKAKEYWGGDWGPDFGDNVAIRNVSTGEIKHMPEKMAGPYLQEHPEDWERVSTDLKTGDDERETEVDTEGLPQGYHMHETYPNVMKSKNGDLQPIPGYTWENKEDPNDFSVVVKSKKVKEEPVTLESFSKDLESMDVKQKRLNKDLKEAKIPFKAAHNRFYYGDFQVKESIAKIWREMMEKYGASELNLGGASQAWYGPSGVTAGYPITEKMMDFLESEMKILAKSLARRPGGFWGPGKTNIPSMLRAFVDYRSEWEIYMGKRGVKMQGNQDMSKKLDELLNSFK